MTNKNALAAQIRSSLHQAKGGSFVIQAGHVTPLFIRQKQVKTLSSAFSVLFSENDESAWLFWNEIPVRFRYKYEFAANWDKIIEWLRKLKAEKSGEYQVTLVTELFSLAIRSSWKNGMLQLVGEWTAKKDSSARMADALNKKNEITLTVNDFIQEWKTLLHQVVGIFETVGIALTDPAEKTKIGEMKKIAVSVDGLGKLYTKRA
jgi:hypothetical protein